MHINTIIQMAILSTVLSGCGGESAQKSTQEQVQKAAKGDKAAMRDLEQMVREKAAAQKQSIENLAGTEKQGKAFYWDLASGKIDDDALRELVSVDENIHAQVYVARTVGKREGLAGADRKQFSQWLEHISTVDTTHMYYALNGGIYPLSGEAAFIISEDYLSANELYPYDMDKAVGWLNKAANLGQPEAMFKLSTRYQYGLDVEKDLSLAKAWMQKSANAGWRDAAQELVKLEK